MLSSMSCELTKNWYTFQEVLTTWSAFFEEPLLLKKLFSRLRNKIRTGRGQEWPIMEITLLSTQLPNSQL